MSCGASRLSLAGVSLALLVAAAAAQEAPKPISPRDAALYREAFAAVRAGDLEGAAAIETRLRDRSLMGRLQYLTLMRPDRRAELSELKAWLSRHSSEPGADKIYQLARKRRLEANLGGDGADLETLVKPRSPLGAGEQAAREAYYVAGDLKSALALAARCQDRWIAGLAAFRLSRFEAALKNFEALAADGEATPAQRTAAAYWAARSAVASGAAERAPRFLEAAAASPASFYGQLAERQLGRDFDAAAVESELIRGEAPTSAVLRAKALRRLVKSDPRARRAAGLVEVGQLSDAAEELRLALQSEDGAKGKSRWRGLAAVLGVALQPPAPALKAPVASPDSYPAPEIEPLGGLSIDRALLYAVVRQESGFNPNALSPAGGYGLMQLTPATAALAVGVEPDLIDGSLLMDPAANLRIGQDHLGRLLDDNEGDLVRALAAYNAGPHSLSKALALAPDADGVTLIESLPAAETREYVRKVLANYWIYKRLFNEAAPSLDAAASGAKHVPADVGRLPARPEVLGAATPLSSATDVLVAR